MAASVSTAEQRRLLCGEEMAVDITYATPVDSTIK